MMTRKAKSAPKSTEGSAHSAATKPKLSEPKRKAPPASVPQEPTQSCESFVKAHGNSPALKRYLLRHYGSGNKTASEWQKIVDGLRVRRVS